MLCFNESSCVFFSKCEMNYKANKINVLYYCLEVSFISVGNVQDNISL